MPWTVPPQLFKVPTPLLATTIVAKLTGLDIAEIMTRGQMSLVQQVRLSKQATYSKPLPLCVVRRVVAALQLLIALQQENTFCLQRKELRSLRVRTLTQLAARQSSALATKTPAWTCHAQLGK
jgi:hypothetical protein